MGGFVARQQDTAPLHAPDEIREGLALDYHDQSYVDRNGSEPFPEGATGVFVLRFNLAKPSDAAIPLGGRTSSERALMDEHTPNGLTQQAPFNGTGYAGKLGISEWKLGDGAPLDGDSVIALKDLAGNEIVLGNYAPKSGTWTLTDAGREWMTR